MAGGEVTLPFQANVQATGHGEVWDHTDSKKFEQFGWRTEKNDTTYKKTGPLMGNWNEERFDVSARCQPAPLPSQREHYFETTQSASYGPRDSAKPILPSLKEGPLKREIRAFPGHQPELGDRKEYFETSSSMYGSKVG